MNEPIDSPAPAGKTASPRRLSKVAVIAIFAAVVAVVLIIGGLAWAGQNRGENDLSETGSKNVIPTATPITEETDETDGVGDDTVGSGASKGGAKSDEPTAEEHQAEHGDLIDLSSSEAVAEAVIREFLKVNPEESTEKRMMRLRPYLAPGAVIPDEPAYMKPGGYNLVGLKVDFTIVDIPDVAIYSVSQDEQSYIYGVSVIYDMTYTSPSEKQNHLNIRKTWQVSLPADLSKPQLVQGITEPV